jgi:hypothetical protein
MNAYRISKRAVFLSAFVTIVLLTSLWSPSPGYALLALPDIGINYQTMKVDQAAKLTAAGMTKARNGDTISMRVSAREEKVIFKNIRTNEELSYPPPQQKGKDR